MFPPKSWNAATAANATSAAATAYSESSKPLSSFKNFLNIRSILLNKLKAPIITPAAHRCRVERGHKELLNLAGEVSDLGGDVGAQQLESGDGCQRDERCGNCVFRKFKTGFIAEKSLNHVVAPLVSIRRCAMRLLRGRRGGLQPVCQWSNVAFWDFVVVICSPRMTSPRVWTSVISV